MWQAILDKIEPPPPLREPLPPPREHVADAAGEIASRGHHKNDRHESDALKSPAPRISWRVSGERLGMAPPFFLLTPVIQDVITSKMAGREGPRPRAGLRRLQPRCPPAQIQGSKAICRHVADRLVLTDTADALTRN